MQGAKFSSKAALLASASYSFAHVAAIPCGTLQTRTKPHTNRPQLETRSKRISASNVRAAVASARMRAVCRAALRFAELLEAAPAVTQSRTAKSAISSRCIVIMKQLRGIAVAGAGGDLQAEPGDFLLERRHSSRSVTRSLRHAKNARKKEAAESAGHGADQRSNVQPPPLFPRGRAWFARCLRDYWQRDGSATQNWARCK